VKDKGSKSPLKQDCSDLNSCLDWIWVGNFAILGLDLVISMDCAGVGLNSGGADGNLNASLVGYGADAVQLYDKGKGFWRSMVLALPLVVLCLRSRRRTPTCSTT
jgi:hypothetical protein